ncbi:endonuclease/exonuclease/phosphatase family protein [Nannocystaceae bacterium ST9]
MRRREWLIGGGALLGCGTASPNAERTEARDPPLATGPSRLRVLTYNVLADPVEVERRIPRLLEIFRDADADLLALQEVAPWFVEILEREGWLRDYQAARIDGELALPNGQMILSRFPIARSRARRLSGRQGRTVLVSEVTLGADEAFVLATTHMESFLEDGPTRALQLDEIFAELAGEVAPTLFAGDLNFGDGEQPDSAHLDPAFVDLWTRLHPGDPGLTWNIERSPMAAAGSFVGEPSRRLDRMLLRASTWEPSTIAIVGDRSVSGDPWLFPSDHFGLVATVSRARE